MLADFHRNHTPLQLILPSESSATPRVHDSSHRRMLTSDLARIPRHHCLNDKVTDNPNIPLRESCSTTPTASHSLTDPEPHAHPYRKRQKFSLANPAPLPRPLCTTTHSHAFSTDNSYVLQTTHTQTTPTSFRLWQRLQEQLQQATRIPSNTKAIGAPHNANPNAP